MTDCCLMSYWCSWASNKLQQTLFQFPSHYEFVSKAAIAHSNSYFGRGTGSILLDQVACTGTETRLVNCPSNPLGVHDCSHSEDAGVTCQRMHACMGVILNLCPLNTITSCPLKLRWPFSKLTTFDEACRFQLDDVTRQKALERLVLY